MAEEKDVQAELKRVWGGHYLSEQIRLGLMVCLVGAQLLLGGLAVAPYLPGLLGSGADQHAAQPVMYHAAASIDPNRVETVIMGYVNGTTARPDPLVAVGDTHANTVAKSSNVHGVVVNGQRYFYSLQPHLSYDPLSRGAVKPQDTWIIAQMNASDGFNVLIYQIGADTPYHA